MTQDLTPMMKQYSAIKSQHQDAILFFRLGDFYEMFFDDAKLASRELEITLTGRPAGAGRKIKIPMCGVPYHAVSGYIGKLLNRGFKVAICEQTEDPALAKGLTKREVVKIITPGTLIESDLIAAKKNNFLAAVVEGENSYGLGYTDISTGEFKVTEIEKKQNSAALLNELDKISPSECLLEENFATDKENTIVKFLKEKNVSLSTFPGYQIFEPGGIIKKHFRVSSLDGFGLSKLKTAQSAAAAILDYLNKTQKTGINQITSLSTYYPEEFMYLDSSTRRNLEILETLKEESYEGSLLWLLDQTKTAMAARLLKQWLLKPLLKEKEINERLDAVEELEKKLRLQEKLSKILDDIHDLERLVGRIASANAHARDLVGLKMSLEKIPEFFETLADAEAKLLRSEKSVLLPIKEIADLIEAAILDEPALNLKEGNLIKPDFHPELGELIKATSNSKKWIAEFEAKEKERTGIKLLKVGYTSVFGYYIEVTKSNLALVPADYIRKQTLVNAERFITPELKEKESFILNAEEKRQKLEYEIFLEIREKVAQKVAVIQKVAQFVAQVDVLLSLAIVAGLERFTRPKILSGGILKIKNGRHPALEKVLENSAFIPNDIEIGSPDNFFHIITGPNMAGKSTFMRQMALIVLMAQIGSFVPADCAEIPLVDRIFTRVGAIDDIFGGQSTFMVEMSEVANILNHATTSSFIILDEIGRGTSTYDGMSIAQAVAEYICQHTKAKTLFATHYHELTSMPEVFPGIKNYTVMVKEKGEDIIFLYKVTPGKASKSYGIHVAKLAGIPKEVIRRARDILINFEEEVSRSRKTKITKEELEELDGGEQLEIF